MASGHGACPITPRLRFRGLPGERVSPAVARDPERLGLRPAPVQARAVHVQPDVEPLAGCGGSRGGERVREIDRGRRVELTETREGTATHGDVSRGEEVAAGLVGGWFAWFWYGLPLTRRFDKDD